MEDQIYDIRKCGISRLKLHGEFPTEHDFGAEKYQILICSAESLYEESVREQLLKLQKKISYAWLLTRPTVCYSCKYKTVGCGCE